MIRFVLLFCMVCSVNAQNEYPTDYFRSPLDIPLVLSGTFGELRSSHFHTGMDIKTKQKEGLKVYSVANGFVSRIKISPFGYGKAVYVTHPNGYTSVYAHLKKLAPALEAYIKECQYEKESFEVEVFPGNAELVITKGEVIAYSGNTGSSGGPHLHFEIRDNLERPINPMLFGIDVKDSKKPYVKSLYVYPKDELAVINGKNKPVKLRLIPKQNGNYETESLVAYGNIGFGLEAYDQQDFAPNRNGLNVIETFFNGKSYLKIDFNRISFEEYKHVKRYVDYKYLKENKSRIQKLFIEKNNPLSIFKYHFDDGYVNLSDSTASVYQIKILDFKQNETLITVPIEGKYEALPADTATVKDSYRFITSDRTTTLSEGKYTVTLYKNTLYDDALIKFKVSLDTLFLHEDTIPLQKNIYINCNIDNYQMPYKEQLYIAKIYGYKKTPYYVPTVNKGNILSAKSDTFGTFALALDTVSPSIEPVNFTNKKWMSKYRYLKVKIDDEGSGISNYRATVNNQWILMEYDYKTKTLTYDFNDNIVNETKNNLKVIVTDNVGNSSTFEAIFYRK